MVLNPNFAFLVSFLTFCELVYAGLPQLNLQDANSIKGVAGQVAHDMMAFYTGNQTGQTPGLLPQPYFQWEAGAMLMAMIDYFYYTGDPTYNDVVTQGMLWQAGPNNDFMDANQSHVEGNDDQAFWGFAALSAAEQGFPEPPAGSPSWIQLAENLFNDQASRWDSSTCNGGLRWQIFNYMAGYDYKSTIANGAFFNIAARLALYTGNDTYAQWANKAYDWTTGAGYATPDFTFYDGAHVTANCSDISKLQWTYNLGVFLHGAATMYSHTGSSEVWKQRILGMMNASSVFVLNDVVYESSCEPYNTCNDSNYSFKSYLIRWLAATSKLAPFVHDQIMPILQSTAKAAAAQCTGGSSGTMCGMKWTGNGQWDGTQGVGQQMGVLQAVTAPLIDSCPSIDTNKVSPSSPPSGGNPDSTGLGQPSGTPPLNSAFPAQPALTGVALACSTCAGGSTILSAPPSAVSSIENLATISGLSVAQSAAAQAIASATASPAIAPGNSIGTAAAGAVGTNYLISPVSGNQSIPTATRANKSGPPGAGITNIASLSSPPIDASASSTTSVGGSQLDVGAADAADNSPISSAGAVVTGGTVGQAASPESIYTGGAAAVRSGTTAGYGAGISMVVALAVLWSAPYTYFIY